ncbi:MAG: thiamine phosphate synthase [Sphingomonas sp.]|nr:thiamine phosphate synthase [Sphingomonas sp.]
MGDGLFAAIGRLPEGSGIVMRHYSLPEAERRELFDRVRATSKNHLLLLAGPAATALAWGADGSHGRGPGGGLRSAPVHDLDEIGAAERDGADLLFLSPLFATRSHPGARPLGLKDFAALVRATRLPVIALGGMDASRARDTAAAGAYGWAGIDAWLGG